MARVVSRSAKSLSEAIAEGEVEVPALMEHNVWLQWRRDSGKRPTKRADGASTTSRFEAEL